MNRSEVAILELLRKESPLYGLDLVERSDGRLKRGTVYVYLHPESGIRDEQLARRQEAARVRPPGAGDDGEQPPEDAVVIQVLLTLIRHPGSGPAQVVRRLRGHAPPITPQQVHTVFTRYDLGEKGGPSKR